MYPTPHIELDDKSKISKTVIMPGDPLRAKLIVDNFLDNVIQINSIRGMLGYTGIFNNKKITVFGSGMGIPSMGIYSYELYKFYDVENIIRIGSAGSYTDTLKIFDIVLATSAWSESTYADVLCGFKENEFYGSDKLISNIEIAAKKLNININKSKIHTSDAFYNVISDQYKGVVEKYNCKAVEMEAFALFANAKLLGKKAACLLTVSDSFITKEKVSARERERSLMDMIKLALEAA